MVRSSQAGLQIIFCTLTAQVFNNTSGERFKAAKASGVMKKCPVLIAAAVEIVEQILREKTR